MDEFITFMAKQLHTERPASAFFSLRHSIRPLLVRASGVMTGEKGERVASIQLTSDMVLCTVQHVGCVDELIARSSYPQFSLRVPQHDLPPAHEDQNIVHGTRHSLHPYLVE